MKSLRVFVAPVVAALVLAGLLVTWHYVSRTPAPGAKTTTPPPVVNVNPDHVRRVEIVSGGRTLVLVGVPQKPAKGSTTALTDWHVGSASGTATQPFAVDQLLFGLNPLTATRRVDTSPAQAGLDKPSQTLTLTLQDGSRVVLEIGGQAPVGGYYARIAGQPQVYLIAATLPQQLNADPTAWLPPPAPAAPPAQPKPQPKP